MRGWMESKNAGNSSQINLILFASQHQIKYGGRNACGLIASIDCIYLEDCSSRMRLQDLCVKKTKKNKTNSDDSLNVTFPSAF